MDFSRRELDRILSDTVDNARPECGSALGRLLPLRSRAPRRSLTSSPRPVPRRADGRAKPEEELRPLVDTTKKVRRYFPGKAPEWAMADAQEERFLKPRQRETAQPRPAEPEAVGTSRRGPRGLLSER